MYLSDVSCRGWVDRGGPRWMHVDCLRTNVFCGIHVCEGILVPKHASMFFCIVGLSSWYFIMRWFFVAKVL